MRDDCDCIGRCGTSVASCTARKQSFGSSTVVNQNRNRRLREMYSTSDEQSRSYSLRVRVEVLGKLAEKILVIEGVFLLPSTNHLCRIELSKLRLPYRWLVPAVG